MDIRQYKEQLLNDLYEPYKRCQKCPLASLGRTQVVFGQGNPDATLMLIGEGPGQQEDLQGKPFVGRSGQLLNKVFEAVGIQRSEVFITNIVKCRPPGNRKPLPLEAKTCKGILLLNQIKIIQPKIICTLGSAAIQGLIDQEVKITKIRGQTISWNNTWVIPTLHPAYVLRNPSKLQQLVDDIELAYKKSS